MIAFYTLLKKEVRRFLRIIGQSLFTPLVTSFLYLLIFGVGIGSQITFEGVPYLVFLIPGLVMMGVVNNSFINPSFSLMISKVYGDIEDYKVTPLSPTVVVWAITTASTIRGILVASIIFLVGEAFVVLKYQYILWPMKPLYLFTLLLSAGYTFSLIGFSVGIFSRSFEKLNSITQFIILPLTYLGGVFFSIENLHPFWQKFSLFNPIFYYINGSRYAFLGISDTAYWKAIAIIAIFFVLSYTIALISAKKASYKHL